MPDEFHERLEDTDVDELNKATMYAVAAPVITGIFVWGYNVLREEGGASSHFAHAISKAKGRFSKSGGAPAQKWSSKRKTTLA
mmetsp:Transcript_3148/g.4245  ORF Transcript_3148/g.4245 Transcript_3148/m.4245 type:complete len:83 (+) Transcript_3148:78-326(+)|eukprot:CAMPEP_0170467166 /NCGR_PEP_ID=MMETSP0123-20130129/10841_1 /TAXON_ID=182087 /ORGANISM="Favella ehrenbergii, Strain Fehren 1" /LENGTH=82 /DNA_ID=CAMNT_0010733453 /DNA_START=58 /DNA_END=306 /DNA_ORIENTATION=+